MKPKILIGYFTKNNKGAIPLVNTALMEGIDQEYEIIKYYLIDRKRGANGQFTLGNIFFLFADWFNWIVLLIKHRPDIVHYPLSGKWAMERCLVFLLSGKLVGAKVFAHLHAPEFDQFWDNLKRTRKFIASKALNKIDCLITLSNYWKGYMKQIIPDEKIAVLNNPISLEFEKHWKNYFQSKDREYSQNKLLFIGSIGRRKGVFDLIEATSKEDLYKIDLWGPEDYGGELEKSQTHIKQKGLSEIIQLKGYLSGQEKLNAFEQSGIFIIPSYHENFPLVIIEAACAGLPIITTPVGALPEFFTHNENIYFVEPGNIGQIHEAIKILVNDIEKREYLGKNARKVFLNKLNRSDIIENLKRIYNKYTE